MKNSVHSSWICLFVLIFGTASLLAAVPSADPAVAETAQVPCYVKISAGGELRIPLDAERKAELELKKAADSAEMTITEYRNGKQRAGSRQENATLDNNEPRKSWRFNKYFDQTPKSSVVDEIRITVQKGAVYAEVSQTGDDRIDFYNTGYQRGAAVNPAMSLSVHITGDNPSGGKTSGILLLEYESGAPSEKIPFTVKKGETLQWDYAAGKGINSVEVDISEGQAKVNLFQAEK